MHDYSDYIVDIDVTLGEATACGERGLDWLIERGIVRAEPCAPEDEYDIAARYLPGPQAAAWSAEQDLETCGACLSVIVGHSVFHSGSNADRLRCPHCQTEQALDAGGAWSVAVDAWFAQDGKDTLACPACGRISPITEWTFLDFDWAFGNLGFCFNCWVIAPRLANAMAQVLGHRVKLVHEH